MRESEWAYLMNLTEAYENKAQSGELGIRRIYTFNKHRIIPCIKIGGVEYYSQEYQDFVIDNLIFKNKEHGFFIDIGGNDPIHINNTYFFERYRKWQGMAFEPIPQKYEKWECRSTECLNIALGSTNGTEEFTEYENIDRSGLSSKNQFDGEIKVKYNVEVRRLDEILSSRDIRHVDYVSLDVEGSELDVLNGIDFEKCSITCFTIELIEKESTFFVRKFMIEHGYEFIGRLWQDDIWVEKGYDWK